MRTIFAFGLLLLQSAVGYDDSMCWRVISYKKTQRCFAGNPHLIKWCTLGMEIEDKTVTDCADACSKDANCRYAHFNTGNKKCTPIPERVKFKGDLVETCPTFVSSVDVYTVVDTESVECGVCYNVISEEKKQRCEQQGKINWNGLRAKKTATACADSCFKDPKCRYAHFNVNKKCTPLAECTSFEDSGDNVFTIIDTEKCILKRLIATPGLATEEPAAPGLATQEPVALELGTGEYLDEVGLGDSMCWRVISYKKTQRCFAGKINPHLIKWGVLGEPDTVTKCADACSKDANCRYAHYNTGNQKCTPLPERVQTNAGLVESCTSFVSSGDVFTVVDTESEECGVCYDVISEEKTQRCNWKGDIHGINWNGLRAKKSATACADACFKHPNCRYAHFNKNTKCTPWEKCESFEDSKDNVFTIIDTEKCILKPPSEVALAVNDYESQIEHLRETNKELLRLLEALQ